MNGSRATPVITVPDETIGTGAATEGGLKYVATIAGVAVAYAVTAAYGLSMATVAKQVSPVWPPSGVALAAVLLLGYRVWPGIAIGAFVVNALMNEPIATAAGIAVGNVLEPLVAAALLHRVVGFRCELERTADIVGLAALGAGLATMVSATFGVVSLCLGGVTAWERFGSLWLTWWLGNGMGALIVAPPLLTFVTWWRATLPFERAAESAVFFIGSGIVSYVVLVDPSVETAQFKYVLFPFFVWSALRLRQCATASALFMVSTVAIWGVDWQSPAFLAETLNARLLLMQTFVGMLALSSLTLGAATAELHRNADTHRRSQERLSAIVHQAISGVAEVDLTGRFVLVNQKYCAIVGRTEEELMRLRMQDITHPDDLPRNLEQFERCVREGIGFIIEKRYLRPDGSVVWVCNNVSKVGDAAGRPEYVVAVVQDISERMEAEERRRLLLAELSHRVKNTLATVLSIVVRTSKSSRSREEFHEDLEARLKSLAETHTLLSREDWAGAELNAIAAGELRPLLAEKAGRVRIEGPRVYLKPHAALSLHLVLHELTTNAAKYGALSAVGGRVDLTWVVEPPGTARALVLRWRESSGPKVAPPERRGFGTTMIVDAVEYELDAKTSLEYREDGFCYDLVIPFTVDVGRVLDGLRGERAGRR